MTTFENKCAILADLWIDYKNDVQFEDFIEYNDLGLPLAYAMANDLATVNPIGVNMIEETWAILLSGLDVEDTGFENLSDLFAIIGDFE